MKASIRHYLALALVLLSASLYADRLGIHNQTPRDLHMAIYYLRMKLPWEDEYPKATLASNINLLKLTVSAPLSGHRVNGYDRELVSVEDKNPLKPELTKGELAKYHSKNVAELQERYSYIVIRKPNSMVILQLNGMLRSRFYKLRAIKLRAGCLL